MEKDTINTWKWGCLLGGSMLIFLGWENLLFWPSFVGGIIFVIFIIIQAWQDDKTFRESEKKCYYCKVKNNI